MLYAKVLRPPSQDATLKSVDASEAPNVRGAIVIQEADLIAVLHEKPVEAEYALELISSKWDIPWPKVENLSIFEHLKKSAPGGSVHVEKGSPADGRAASMQSVESEF